ncbi:DUF3422 family protein [Amaricoccus solimangrovi]|uniref:DUF3422 domain-containing protein n=1 Tax=Amaricoccus solimangrovi TaxID=2589815 RepID=A0A501WQY2_9RHOB|nr:DUF3422 domain-containing protein [Amaricoccus solimangrovi]TPE52183.1 DUF3422 domain-containing protein [Amaricoccus solimangrovi]
MTQLSLDDHPDRYRLANELHARPFPELRAPCRAAHLAIKQPTRASERDRSVDFAHLIKLLDRFGAPHPPPGANHYAGEIGRGFLKWEMHTEFVTYTIFAPGLSEQPFSGDLFALFPSDWLAEAPGKIVTSALIRVERMDQETTESRLRDQAERWFVPESLTASRVIDGEAVIATDFRIDENGHSRMAIFAQPDIGGRRLGRIAQRLLEIDTYKSMALLTLPRAQTVAAAVSRIDTQLSAIVGDMAEGAGEDSETLARLLGVSAEIEHLSATSAFRFGAAEAYEAIVNHRIQVLREQRIGGRQLFEEFMMRRFDPAMRTCRSARERLTELSLRAERVANLLRTRVDVENQRQNNEILAQMSERGAMQLRLQETVEGLSVVAISYYAVSLGGYLLGPLAEMGGIEKPVLTALLVVPVVLGVWFMMHRVRARLAGGGGH